MYALVRRVTIESAVEIASVFGVQTESVDASGVVKGDDEPLA
jgi:hypothetical protein